MSAPAPSHHPTSRKGKKRLETMIARGRRGSAAAIARLRSGSLPSWAGGPPSSIHPQTPTIDEEHEYGFPYPTINDEDDSETDVEEAEPLKHNHIVIAVDEEATMKHKKPKIAQMTRSRSDLPCPRLSRVQGNVDLGLVLSGMYAKLLVVMGIAFPLSEVISSYIPHRFYDGFYIYLYLMSILFMVCILGNVVKQKAKRSAVGFMQRMNDLKTKFHHSSTDSGVAPDVISNGHSDDSDNDAHNKHHKKSTESPKFGGGARKNGGHGHGHRHPGEAQLRKIDSHHSMMSGGTNMGDKYRGHHRYHFGSFYLRMGAMAFGIGSMIYSGLEFGQYFELEVDTKCHNYMMALTPTVRMIFTFMQMYFIFLNSNMAVGKTSIGVQFGLMHMIGTNLCVWLNVLVEETRHEILHFYDPTNQSLILPHQGHGHGYHGSVHGHGSHHYEPEMVGGDDSAVTEALNSTRVKRGLRGMYECRRSNIMGTLVNNASPFLFPCTIEYSLICAAICYVMWKSTAKRRAARYSTYRRPEPVEVTGLVRSPHHYTVDCAGSNKGLFLGIMILVLTIMSLIINMVLHARPGYGHLAVMQVNIVEVVVYSITTLAVLLGMCQVRELQFDKGKNLELDNILLIVAQTGSLIYNVFTIIGAQFTTIKDNKLVLMTALASLIQLLLQTLFIIDASKRSPATAEQASRKPGREVVTFLLVGNLAMWLIHTLENSRGDSHPLQLEFYGIWAWTIITDISMPLAIFYRFHSTVCLCEIWKKAYKVGKDREGRI